MTPASEVCPSAQAEAAADPLALVRRGLHRLQEERERERLRLYRLELQVTVTSVPDLARDLAEDAGLDLHEIAWSLPVPRGWWGHGREVLRPRLSSDAWFVPAAKWARRRAFVHPDPGTALSGRLDRRGLLLRDEMHPRGVLGVVVGDCGLEMVSASGQLVLHVGGRTGRLLFRGELPDTLLRGMPGRPLGELLSHPVLDRGTYRVLSARQHPHGVGTVVTFRVPAVPFSMPWADELRRAREAGE